MDATESKTIVRQHVAGEMKGGEQRCARCGEVLVPFNGEIRTGETPHLASLHGARIPRLMPGQEITLLPPSVDRAEIEIVPCETNQENLS